MDSHLLLARVKHEFQRMTADILCIQVLLANRSNFDFHKIKEGVLRALYRETFERGGCEACLQVVHSRTFP